MKPAIDVDAMEYKPLGVTLVDAPTFTDIVAVHKEKNYRLGSIRFVRVDYSDGSTTWDAYLTPNAVIGFNRKRKQ